MLAHEGKLAMVACAASLVSGCATVNGQPFARADTFRIETTPAGAAATSEYGDSCTTPCRLPLPIDRGGQIEIVLDGFVTETIYVNSHADHGRQMLTASARAVDPNPVDLGIDAFFLLFNRNGLYRSLDADRVDLVLVPASMQQMETLPEIGVSGAEDALVYRLTDEEITAIRSGNRRTDSPRD